MQLQLEKRMNEIIKRSNDCCSDIFFRIWQLHLESLNTENGKASEVYDVFEKHRTEFQN